MSMKTRIIQARKAKGISQSELARLCGIKVQSVQQWEKGTSEPRRERLKKLAIVLGMTETWLLELDQGKKTLEVRSARAGYNKLSAEAEDIGRIWQRLPEDRRKHYKDSLFIEMIAINKIPWLRIGRPDSLHYDQFETDLDRSYKAQNKDQ